MSSRSFKFNLLPKPSQQEVVIAKERDSSVFYSTALLVFVAISWLLSTVFLNVVVLPQLQSREDELAELQAQLLVYDDLRALRGELVLKTQSLEPLLGQRINTDQIFSVADGLVENMTDAGIYSYGKESSGKYVFTLITRDYNQLAVIMDNARGRDDVADIEVRSSAYNSEVSLVFHNIALTINEQL